MERAQQGRGRHAVLGAVATALVVLFVLMIFVLQGVLEAREGLIRVNHQLEATEALQDGWVRYEGSGVVVEFPGGATSEREAFEMQGKKVGLEQMMSASRNGGAYSLRIIDVETDPLYFDATLREAVRVGASAQGAELVREIHYGASGASARAYYEIAFPNEGVKQEVLLVATREAFYELMVLYEPGVELAQDVDRFIASFERM